MTEETLEITTPQNVTAPCPGYSLRRTGSGQAEILKSTPDGQTRVIYNGDEATMARILSGIAAAEPTCSG